VRHCSLQTVLTTGSVEQWRELRASTGVSAHRARHGRPKDRSRSRMEGRGQKIPAESDLAAEYGCQAPFHDGAKGRWANSLQCLFGARAKGHAPFDRHGLPRHAARTNARTKRSDLSASDDRRPSPTRLKHVARPKLITDAGHGTRGPKCLRRCWAKSWLRAVSG